METTTDPRPWIGFQRISGVGPAAVRKLQEYFGTLAAAWEASELDLREAGIQSNAARAIVNERQSIDVDAELEVLQQHDVRIITLDDQEYPRLLREVPNGPPLLYLKGTLEPMDDLAVGIVGTRRSTAYGADMARRIARDLAGAGVTIVSGLALGIDTVSHRAALEAGGRTVAVCGCGLDIVYPPRNRRLAAQIIDQGALISEYPLHTQPDGRNFPARNRIISGMSRGVVVVEAPSRSGALITTSFAADQGRDVYAVPGSALSKTSQGCHDLIREGATLITSAEHVLDDLHMESAQSAVQARMTLPENELERQLYDLIGAEPRHINELCHVSNMPIQETSGLLLALELKGLIRQQGAQHYVRSS